MPEGRVRIEKGEVTWQNSNSRRTHFLLSEELTDRSRDGHTHCEKKSCKAVKERRMLGVVVEFEDVG